MQLSRAFTMVIPPLKHPKTDKATTLCTKKQKSDPPEPVNDVDEAEANSPTTSDAAGLPLLGATSLDSPTLADLVQYPSSSSEKNPSPKALNLALSYARCIESHEDDDPDRTSPIEVIDALVMLKDNGSHFLSDD